MNCSVIINTYNVSKIILEKAKSDWCFLIDSDEIVTSTLAKKNYIKVTGVMHSYLEIINYPQKIILKEEQYTIIRFPHNTIEDWLKKRLRYIKVETKMNKKFRSPFILFITTFIKHYFKDKGYKDGYNGFILSLTQCTRAAIANYKNYYESKNIDINKVKENYLKQ